MKNDYSVPSGTSIGHVHLKVADLSRALDFYHDLLGFEITQFYGNSAAFVSAGGYHHHIGLNTWHSEGTESASPYHPGLYHLAILYPARKDLATIYRRLKEHSYPITGASDHGVSEAIYLQDPDNNGVELYWDRPKEQWPVTEDGELKMVTERLDSEDLLGELE